MDERSGSRTPIGARIAAAPISWGVCEVPGWGHQLHPDQVLSEMRSLGITATEFGPAGFLADEPAAKAAQLESYGMTAVGGFLPILLHDPLYDPLPEADSFVDSCIASGASVMVLAAYTGVDGYDARPQLDELGWNTMLTNVDRITDQATARGVLASLHPHIGTMVEQSDEVVQVMQGSHVGLCVDTGHLAVGGADPVALAATYADRVTHVHLKDVDAGLAQQVFSGELAFGDAVRAGVFRPLGQGDLDLATLVRALESSGYQGWYVLEQDVMLDGEPDGAGPVQAGPLQDVRDSLDFLRGVAA